MTAETPRDATCPNSHDLAGFEPVNELERVIARCVTTGARATLLRALARSAVCVRADTLRRLDRLATGSGRPRRPHAGDLDGSHVPVFTSHRQLSLATRHHANAPEDTWREVPVGSLFARWPRGVDVWLNPGRPVGFPLDGTLVDTVADLAAGIPVDEAFEIGPDDDFTDFPGPRRLDEVDQAAVMSLYDAPDVLEVFRVFRRLEEPGGRTWRVLLVLTDRGERAEPIVRRAADAIGAVSQECCEIHVADVLDDNVFDAVGYLVHIGVPLWRREGPAVPDSPAELYQLDAGDRPDDLRFD